MEAWESSNWPIRAPVDHSYVVSLIWKTTSAEVIICTNMTFWPRAIELFALSWGNSTGLPYHSIKSTVQWITYQINKDKIIRPNIIMFSEFWIIQYRASYIKRFPLLLKQHKLTLFYMDGITKPVGTLWSKPWTSMTSHDTSLSINARSKSGRKHEVAHKLGAESGSAGLQPNVLPANQPILHIDTELEFNLVGSLRKAERRLLGSLHPQPRFALSWQR